MQQYKIAENKVFSIDDHDFLYLVKENAIFEIDTDTKRILDQGAAPHALPMDEILARIDGPRRDNVELFEGLLRRRIVEPENGKASPQKLRNNRAQTPLSTLILNVTDACNLSCRYCYQERENGRAKRTAAMTRDVAQKAIDFLFERSRDHKRLTLVFFGGEPFLNFDLISFAVEYARDKAASTGKEIDFAVTTNGTLLTDNVIHFIRENEIGVTVSVDGFGRAHDRYRRFHDGSPSFQAIAPGVDRLLRAPHKRPVVARATIARDHEDLPPTLDRLLDMGFAEAGFAPVTSDDAAYRLDAEGMERLLGQFGALSRSFLEIALDDGFFGFSNLIDLLVVLHEGEIKSHPCGAGLGLLSVNPAGGLYLCQRLTGEDRPCLGDVFEGVDEAKIDEFMLQVEADRKDFCSGCWVRTTCAGGCYHEAFVRGGGLTRPNTHYCEWIKGWVEIGMEIYGRLALSRPEYLQKLSALRGHAGMF